MDNILVLNKIVMAFFEVYNQAIARGLSLDNICLYAHENILKELGLNSDTAMIRCEYGDVKFKYDLKIIINNRLVPEKQDDGLYTSDLWIYNPDWITEEETFYCDGEILIDKDD